MAAAAAALQPRSLRIRLAQLGLLLLSLPLGIIGVAAAYERHVVQERQQGLARAAAEVRAADLTAHGAPAGDGARERIATRAHVLLARLDPHGAVVGPIAGAGTSLESSALAVVGERIVSVGRVEAHPLVRADAALPPWPARPEVQAALAGQRAFGRHLTPDGAALLITLADPLPGGGALYLLAGTHRGIRRLAVVQRQLIQLLIYELVLAVPLVLLFAVGIVRPLEQLAAAARRYPASNLADRALLARRDEIGALARTLVRLAEDLDGRRREAADLGADVAHEFKNPLATIAASAELLSSTKSPTPERVALVAGTIGASVERLRRSIDELLWLLRLEQALPGEDRAPTHVADLLRELADEYGRDPRAAGFQFEVSVSPDAAARAPLLNRARVLEMLRNIVENALIQPTADPRIHLDARVEDGELVVSVRDQGPGISRENQARIFERFFTQRPEGAPPGTGLGLAIASSVARAHGGRVEVRSELGKGAEFNVIFPP